MGSLWQIFFIISSVSVWEGGGAGFVDWLGGWGASPLTSDSGAPLLSVPFEELAPEEKFLVEASKITGLKLSQLDTCQHKLVMKLKTSCASLSEEELAKLSVNLLNCQSAVEGRKEFPCTDNMSLKACTGSMDPETWNAYHVISNRARAVCYAARQQQFRALSEMTVNKLMSTAHSHIAAISALQDKQEKMQSSALTTMNELSHGTREVIKVHNAVRYSQTSIKEEIANHLKLLQKEKDFIAEIQDRLTALTSRLDGKLEEATNQLEHQFNTRQEDHSKLLNNFQQLSDSTLKVWHQIEKSAKTAEEQNQMSENEFKKTLDTLREINASISYVSKLAEMIREQADVKYGYVTSVLGTNGEELDRSILMLVHAASMLLFMLISSFLQVPRTSRWLLLVVAPLNLNFALRENLHDYSLDVARLYSALTAFTLGDVAVRWLTALYSAYKKRRGMKKHNKAEEIFKENETLNNSVHESEVSESHSKVNSWLKARGKYSLRDDLIVSSSNGLHTDINHRPTPLTTFREEDRKSVASENSIIRRRVDNDYRRSTSRRSIGRSSVGSNRPMCLALTKNGQQCRLRVHDSALYCHKHATSQF